MDVRMPEPKAFTKSVALAAALVMLGFFASCGEITTTSTQGVVHGVITSNDTPLAGVVVSGGTEVVTSDTAGTYSTVIPVGEWTITFTKSGYNVVSKTVTAVPNSQIKADIAMTTQTSPTPTPGTGATFTVSPGAYQRVRVMGPGKMSFTVVGINMDLDKDAWPIVYFYDDKGYTGGKGGSGGFNGELRSYKLKFYDVTGAIASESYYVEPRGNTPPWNASVARAVTLEWGPDFVESTVDGIPFRKSAPVAGTFILGIGYPPRVRPGWDGAVYTNIVWPAGAIRLD